MRGSLCTLVLLSVCAAVFSVPTPERLEALRKRRAEDDHPSFPFERVSSMGHLVAHDAHRIYRKSFDGVTVDDMNAMLDQLFDGQMRLWQELSRFTSDDADDSDDEDDENVFTQLLGQLQLDPETMSTLVSSTDHLEVDGKRMECMMELLNQLSSRIRQSLSQLDDDSGSWIRRLVVRQIKSAMEAMLRVIDDVKTIMEDAESEAAAEDKESESGEAEAEAETTGDSSDGTEVQDGTLELGSDEETEEVESEAEAERVDVRDVYKFNEDDVFRRRKRSTVTSQFRSPAFRTGRARGNWRYKSLTGGWSRANNELSWRNRRHRSRSTKYVDF